MTSAPRPAVPGLTTDPGSRPAVVEVFDALVDDAAIGLDPRAGVAVHELNRAAWARRRQG